MAFVWGKLLVCSGLVVGACDRGSGSRLSRDRNYFFFRDRNDNPNNDPPNNDPPNLLDVFRAQQFARVIEDNYFTPTVDILANQGPTQVDVARAHIYRHNIIDMASNIAYCGMIQQAVAAAIQPINVQLNGITAQLGVINGRLDGIDDRLDGVDGRLDGIDGQLTNVEQRLVDLTEVSYMAYNGGCGEGLERDFREIPFRLPDSTTELPTAVGLPALTGMAAIHALSNVHLNTYLQRYGIPNVGNPSRAIKMRRLSAFLGCTFITV
ncbi:hypothetical protein BU15DRAFT_67211 [Melanogaster broomeanus]|nr:hypothetical protein BU15DRAFT_67211 [Melanogaster broomeanus]